MQNKTMKKILICLLLSMVISMLVMAFAYYKVGIYPGGQNTVLTFDMLTQYMPFFATLRYIGISDNSFFFNMSGALGNNFLGLAYYIFSPFSWITVLFPLEMLPTAIYFTNIIRIGLCGVTFCIYVLYTFDRNRYYIGAVLLSCCYALMSYNVGYSINVMWLDAVLMLPIILIGIERILRNHNSGVLIISIALSMIWNYYITCMSLVFVAFYTVIRLTELNKWSVKRIINMAVSGLIGIGLSMPFILPGLLALKDGKMDEPLDTLTQIFRYNIFEVLGQLLSGKYATIWDNGLPLIFCGTGTLVLVVCFFVSRNNGLKIKILYGAAIVFYLFSMCFIPLDRVMHGFRETVCCEVRYSFAFCCLLLIIAYRAIDVPCEIIKRYHLSKGICYLLGVFVLIELCMNSAILISGRMEELHYKTAVEYNMILRDKSGLLDLIDDEGFYRVSDDNSYTNNDGAWLGYNGFGYFSSSYNLGMMNYLGSIGECQSYHILEDHDRSPLEESLFGAKYKLSYAGWRKADEIIDTQGLYTLSKNNDALSLGYMVDYKLEDDLTEVSTNAFDNQNNLAKELSGLNEDVWVQLEPIDYDTIIADGNTKCVRLNTITKLDASLWIYISKKDEENSEYVANEQYERKEVKPKLFINGGDYGAFKGEDTKWYYMLYIGDFTAGEHMEIELQDSDSFGKVTVAQFDENVFHKEMDWLSTNQLELTEHGSGKFYGKIDAGTGGNMFLSLPAIEGWKIRVDGETISPENYRNVFLLVPMTEGLHEVEIEFVSPGLWAGITIGVISLMCLAIIVYRARCCNKI